MEGRREGEGEQRELGREGGSFVQTQKIHTKTLTTELSKMTQMAKRRNDTERATYSYFELASEP